MIVPVRIALLFVLLAAVTAGIPRDTLGQPPVADSAKETDEQGDAQAQVTLSRAVMCERVDKLTPVNEAVVFSVQIGQCSCLTTFDPVEKPTYVFHRWYHLNELSTQIRLRVYPPRWTTYSLIHLREADKGPWRVEIADEKGNILKTLRFGITD